MDPYLIDYLDGAGGRGGEDKQGRMQVMNQLAGLWMQKGRDMVSHHHNLFLSSSVINLFVSCRLDNDSFFYMPL